MKKHQLICKQLIRRGFINLYGYDVECPDGKIRPYEVIEARNAVAIVVVTPEDEVVLVKQYRPAVGGVIKEIPAGRCDDGEGILDTAIREMLEETGYQVDHTDMIWLTSSYFATGYCSEKLDIVLAPHARYVGRTKCDDDEFIEIEKVPLAKAHRNAFLGVYSDAKTQLGIMLAYHYMGELHKGL